MGFIDSFSDSRTGQDEVFYNVVHCVGKYAPNASDDAKLVQYLLKSFYQKAYTASPIYQKPSGEMTVDGLCGPITIKWIITFQTHVNLRHPGISAVDGRVDRCRNKDGFGSISDTAYSIILLNRFTRYVNPDAYVQLPFLISFQNPNNIPPPSNDVVYQPAQQQIEVSELTINI